MRLISPWASRSSAASSCGHRQALCAGPGRRCGQSHARPPQGEVEPGRRAGPRPWTARSPAAIRGRGQIHGPRSRYGPDASPAGRGHAGLGRTPPVVDLACGLMEQLGPIPPRRSHGYADLAPGRRHGVTGPAVRRQARRRLRHDNPRGHSPAAAQLAPGGVRPCRPCGRPARRHAARPPPHRRLSHGLQRRHREAVQRMLGHASAAMTPDVYPGFFDDDHRPGRPDGRRRAGGR
jgi:hypothetical protein